MWLLIFFLELLLRPAAAWHSALIVAQRSRRQRQSAKRASWTPARR